jgi:hypothetical protein
MKEGPQTRSKHGHFMENLVGSIFFNSLFFMIYLKN